MAARDEQTSAAAKDLAEATWPPTRLVLLCGILAGVIFGIDLAIPLGVASGMLYVVVVLLALRAPRREFVLWITAVCSVLVVAGLIFSPSAGTMWQILLNRGLSLLIVWAAAVLGIQRKQAEREREAALKHIKVLRGMLPICASCKKIRDDRGYWNQIEEYLRTHSDATFTHSICPECVATLYPELDDEAKKAS